MLEEIAAKDAARAADVLRPSVLRAEAVAFAGLTDFDKAIGRLQELSEQRSREHLANPCERARDRCVEAQVLFSANRLGSAEVSKMLAEAGDQVQSMYGERSPAAQLARRLANRLRTAKGSVDLGCDPILV